MHALRRGQRSTDTDQAHVAPNRTKGGQNAKQDVDPLSLHSRTDVQQLDAASEPDEPCGLDVGRRVGLLAHGPRRIRSG